MILRKKHKQRPLAGSIPERTRTASASGPFIRKMQPPRPDRDGAHRGAFERNKKKIYATQTVCGICGKPVDFSLKYPNPLSPCVDHIIPIAKGGHPSDLENLQLAHWVCNRQKADKLFKNYEKKQGQISNRNLPQSKDWTAY